MHMSQNQTEHFGLHLWEPGDHFLREEFNNNFTKLDAITAEKTGMVFGVYIGDGMATQHIELGWRPAVVYTLPNSGKASTYNQISGGLFGDGFPMASNYGAVDATGFTVTKGGNSEMNLNKQVYYYIAFL